ncbi:DEAD/DEAH box helicase [Tahibacter harae]|uniref:DEAD/DEAH box helicase n=1 Tax=Tahibacter harae TaxID=2963937 RepID=A0ABT1QS56_9GAMM|nr:DEAD/DEAH box helicase [Tahibacter harae]MCQ4165101.1 DEAD/DEAH box helicase [Tahibacter harae]
MQLRPYQREAIDSAWKYLRACDGNPCLVLPVGAGKTIVMAELIREAITAFPGTRIAVVAHVRELVAQNADKLRRHWPEAKIGIYSASLNRRDRFEPVTFASIQSVYDKAMQLGRFDLVLVDEAHRIPLRSEGMYRTFLEGCQRANPAVRVIGLTATPYRLGAGMVCGPDYILNDVAYEARIADLIRDGFLSPLVSKGGAARADLSGVPIRNNEYAAKQLEQASRAPGIVEAACDEIVRYCSDRRAWVLFCAGVSHANDVAAELVRRGVAAAVVEGDMPATRRDRAIEDFQQGRLRALVNVNVLCEGFDAPHVDAVVMLRSTKSAGLYVQQVGRGTRLCDGKANCLVLDFAGNIAEHGPVDSITVRAPRKAGDKAEVEGAPTKECPQCQAIVVIQVRTCSCGYLWPFEASPRHDATATDAEILSGAVAANKHAVTAIHYARHEKPGSVPSLRVTYSCGLRLFREWICLEHGGLPRGKAVAWWTRRLAGEVPTSIDRALALAPQLARPTHIFVAERGKYPEITSHEFDHARP